MSHTPKIRVHRTASLRGAEFIFAEQAGLLIVPIRPMQAIRACRISLQIHRTPEKMTERMDRRVDTQCQLS